MARSAELVGEPPMRYVTRWRMHVAATVLREEDATIVEVADRLGYPSEAAFSWTSERGPGGRGRLVGPSEPLGYDSTLLPEREAPISGGCRHLAGSAPDEEARHRAAAHRGLIAPA